MANVVRIIKVDREGFALGEYITGDFFVGTVTQSGDIWDAKSVSWYNKESYEKAILDWEFNHVARSVKPEKWLKERELT